MASNDLTKLHRTAHRGVSFRKRADGSRRYYVYFRESYVSSTADGQPLLKLDQAIERKGQLTGHSRRGEQPVLATKTVFSELAEEWFQGKRLRPKTATGYRDALDLVLVPRFGEQKIASISADAIAKLIRELEREGLHAIDPSRPLHPLGYSAVTNYLLPLQGILKLALRRRHISFDPYATLTKGERPQRAEKAAPYEWSEAEISELLSAAQRIASQSEARQDYSFLLRLTALLGLRLGEVLGLQWQDFDRAEGVLRVKRQWCSRGEYGPTKTRAGVRSLPLDDKLRDELIAFKLASRFSADEDPVFCSRNGTSLGHRNVTRRGFGAARDLAELPGHLTFHDLRHAVVSRLIDAGLDVVKIAAFIGHDDPSITLKVYAHRFNRDRGDEAIRLALAGAH